MVPLVLTAVLLLVSTLLFCGKKTPAAVVASSTSETRNELPANWSVKTAKTPGREEPPKDQERKEEKTDCTLDKLSAVEKLLNPGEGPLDEEYIQTVLLLAIKTESYMWAIKKRLSADENSWKELSKKIEKLKAEGFCVKAGSEEAKRLRKQGEGGHNLLAATMAKNKAASRIANKEQ